MKKVLFTVALLFGAFAASAQVSVVKEAKAKKGNPAEAAKIIEAALTNPETANDPETWKLAGDFQKAIYDAENEKLYFTVKTMFHVYEDTIETATYVIDTETWKAEKINDEWYTMLCKDGDNIIGVGNGRFSLKRKVIICGS